MIKEAHGKNPFQTTPPCTLIEYHEVRLSHARNGRHNARSLPETLLIEPPDHQFEPPTLQWPQKGSTQSLPSRILFDVPLNVLDRNTSSGYLDRKIGMKAWWGGVAEGHGNHIARAIVLGIAGYDLGVAVEICKEVAGYLEGNMGRFVAMVLDDEGAGGSQDSCHGSQLAAASVQNFVFW